MWSRLRERVPSALTLLHAPAGLSWKPLVLVEHTGSPRKTGLGGGGSLSLTWDATDHRFRSLFIKQQVIVARTLAPVTRATPVPTNRGTNRVSRAGGERMACSESICHTRR